MKRLRPISHDAQLTVVDHLSEFRSRLIVSLVVCGGLFAVCLWQAKPLLSVINRPLTKATHNVAGANNRTAQPSQLYVELAKLGKIGAENTQLPPAVREQLARVAVEAQRAAKVSHERATRPVTLGVGEPFTATLQVAFYAAVLLAAPFLLYQLYAFTLPALSRRERRVALPAMAVAPFLFAAGVCFCYFVVLPNAMAFMQSFNRDNFEILLGARDFYRFSAMALVAFGLLFQIPLVIVALTTLGVITEAQLRANRRYAIVGSAFIAMMVPGGDPVTMLAAMVPLLMLYEGSILLSSLLKRYVRPPRDLSPEVRVHN